MPPWTPADIPDQHGRVAVVTGANSGVGFATARALAARGARVLLACRSPERGGAAVAALHGMGLPGRAQLCLLDLADLDSVQACADHLLATLDRLDLLVDNAGLLRPPRGRTAQGHDLQFGVNHLGHFALTGRLLPLLRATPGARVVVVSSLTHWRGWVDLDDPDFLRRPYRASVAYAQSKLANLLFAQELHRRLRQLPHGPGQHDDGLVVTAAHPGWTATDLTRTLSPIRRVDFLAMTPDQGAGPILRAATDPAATSGSYWGPGGLLELRGPPAPARLARRALDRDAARRLWTYSEARTGVRYGLPPTAEAA